MKAAVIAIFVTYFIGGGGLIWYRFFYKKDVITWQPLARLVRFIAGLFKGTNAKR